MNYNVFEKVAKYWLAVLLVGLEIFVAGSLVTFSATDSSWFYHATQAQAYKNIFGFFGSHCAASFIYLFGKAAILSVFVAFYFTLFYLFSYVVKKIQVATEWDRALGVVIGFFSAVAFCQIYAMTSYDFSYSGGIVGNYLVTHLFASFDSLTQKIIIWMCELHVSIIYTVR